MADAFFTGFVFGTVFWIFVLLMLVHETWRRINTLELLLAKIVRTVRKAYDSEDDLRALSSSEAFQVYQECSNAVRWRDKTRISI